MYDLIIIGAGPAGLTAGIYAKRSGLKVLILEKETIGGQIASSPLVENYPGLENISGIELANNFYNQVLSLGCDFEIEEVLKVKPGKTHKVITDYNEYETKSIIIASGAKHKLLGMENEENHLGSGIHFCATCDGSFYKDKDVAIIGGGNTAVQDAIYLAGICHKVYMLVRKNTLKCEKSLKEKLKKIKNMEILYQTSINKIPENDITNLEINENGQIKNLTVDGVFLAIGHKPSTERFKDITEQNSDGYIKADNLEGKYKGIFIAGDCREKEVRQLTTATADGTVAALKVIDYLNNMEVV